MTHKIPFSFEQSLPLPIPHFFGFPEYTEQKIYDVIIPDNLLFEVGDEVIMVHDPESVYSKKLIIEKIVNRRPAKGDWTKQKAHKNPAFVRFVA